MIPHDLLNTVLDEHPYPLLFATISGAHLYGFPSPDSDFDLRGVHLLPPRELLSLETKRETVSLEEIRQEREIDLVTHDAGKFFQLLLKRNGYVLEQLYSPLIVRARPEHEELKQIAAQCITRHHSHHYLGFAATQWGLFQKESPPRIKPLLYVFRVLLTGIHLMRTGRVEANLPVLNEDARLPYVDDLIHRKTTTAEDATLAEQEIAGFEAEYRSLTVELELAAANSDLPERPAAFDSLNALLLRLRCPPVSQ